MVGLSYYMISLRSYLKSLPFYVIGQPNYLIDIFYYMIGLPYYKVGLTNCMTGLSYYIINPPILHDRFSQLNDKFFLLGYSIYMWHVHSAMW